MTRPWSAGDEAPGNTARIQQCVRRAARAIFGDRYGFVLFLATLVFVATYWRIGVFITDG